MSSTSITADPENLTAINALAGMGILTNDDSLVEAALSEILSLPLERRHELDPRRDVDYLLIQHYLGQVSKRALHNFILVLHHLTGLDCLLFYITGRYNTSTLDSSARDIHRAFPPIA